MSHLILIMYMYELFNLVITQHVANQEKSMRHADKSMLKTVAMLT